MTEPKSFSYTTHLDIKFDPLALIDVDQLAKSVTDQWYNQTLCKVNDSVVRLGVMQGEYHWHKHDNDDEFFFRAQRHVHRRFGGPLCRALTTARLRSPKRCNPSHARPREGCRPNGRDGDDRADRRRLTSPRGTGILRGALMTGQGSR